MYKTIVLLVCLTQHAVFGQSVTVTATRDVIPSLKGQNITLECRISGSGPFSVRWGLPLGVLIKVYPDIVLSELSVTRGRFEIAGDLYRLHISNVQPIDDGVYRCIVADTSTSTDVVKTVTVNVFVKPSAPTITGVENAIVEPKADSQQIGTISIPYGSSSARIRCTVGPAKPAIPIKWYLEDELIESNLSPLETTTDEVTNLETTSNVLILPEINKEMTGSQYKCLADLSAINVPSMSLISPFTIFNLSVQYPPSDPVIENFQDTVREPGDVERLTCKTIGGNPLPTLTWYRNDENLNIQYLTFEETKTVESELVIDIKASDNNANYRCEAKNGALREAKQRTVTFKVNFPPQEVVITGHEQVKVGESIVLSCTSSHSNPRAVIRWSSRGRLIVAADDATEVTESADGGYITQTNITVVANRTDQGADFMCRAENPAFNSDAIAIVRLDVLYPPDRVFITGFNDSQPVKVGTVVKATCTSTNGNPLPTLTWYKGDVALPSTDKERTSRGIAQYLELNFVAKPEDNGIVYKCSASSPATASPVKHASFSLSVYFPPQDVVITATEPMKEGLTATLTCSSGTSNPQSEISWAKNETDVFDTVSEGAMRNGDYGGKITVSSYTFTPKASDNGLIVLCNARNPQIRRITTKSMALNVHHKPIFVGVRSTIDIQEGKNVTNIEFSAKANPSEIAYTWFTLVGSTETEIKFEAKRDGSANELKVEGGVLSLYTISRSRAGLYRVKAANGEGTSSHDFTINVQYGPGIPEGPSQASEGESLKLSCTIEANPLVTENTARWVRSGYDMSRATSQLVRGEGHKSMLVLTIENVIRDDIGTFTCEANNTFGTVSKEYVVATVDFAPVIDKSPSISKAAAQTRDNGVIKCNLEAFPQPTVIWSKDGTQLTIDDAKYIGGVSSGATEIEFFFTLTVANVGEDDYGTYTCTATNNRGTASHDITLSGTSGPDPPTDLQVLNVTDSSVNLTWVPGFDGGLTQTFTIRYHIPSDGSAVRKYVDAPSAPFTLNGLQPESTYELAIRAFNEKDKSEFQSTITVTTEATPSVTSLTQRPEEPLFIAIMAIAVVGGLLIIVTTVLICVFVRRRRRQSSEATDSTSQSNTVEMYGTHDGSYYNDDAKSYSTYDKGLDDDFEKHYDRKSPVHQSGIENKTYLNSVPVEPATRWAKQEDPLGHSGTYGRQQEIVPSESSTNHQYVENLREIDRTIHPQVFPPFTGVDRPDFAKNRPPAPRPPGIIQRTHSPYSTSPSIPERGYSPLPPYNIQPDETRGQLV